jgi:hypothetical protein
VLRLLVPANDVATSWTRHPDDESETFLRNVDSYKRRVASHPRRRHCSSALPITGPDDFHTASTSQSVPPGQFLANTVGHTYSQTELVAGYAVNGSQLCSMLQQLNYPLSWHSSQTPVNIWFFPIPSLASYIPTMLM